MEKKTDRRATPAPKATPEPKATPAPKTTPTPRATPAPKPPKTSKTPTAPKPAPAIDEGADPNAIEQARFNAAKSKALEDSEIQELKQKSDDALDEAEGPKAMRAYNKALFRKMRSIDPSIKERIDATEAAILRKLGE
jgi:hypothetical protein